MVATCVLLGKRPRVTSATMHNLRPYGRMQPAIMKFAAVHTEVKTQDLAPVLVYIEAKQTQGKKISRHNA